VIQRVLLNTVLVRCAFVAHLYTTPANGLIHSRPRDATIL
jgi:hypothetical protein